MHSRHLEQHRSERTGWLRAAVLGANDGIVSTASLVLGVLTRKGTFLASSIDMTNHNDHKI
jgi:VIT1/CCC1 family predicted Fe2+/Mn2+ transporter